ncbi:helix-turn-helix domain-containing protein [Fructobacillus fructosus]|uniref:helix-turn-helix domain-containing protein n=1 Tax=Fructobacillus fructosus TaxID=1631 RepID=UPI001658A675|nr:helix-turn-helix transcriptional regulator [Fructobacillus fructosus]MBC9118638.1 helix-turn-helix transcriptional regulator [Fructobacillus fructosus]MBD9365301.1 helix-turn-helix transcriptional regulator [Leuconostoc mesenteroides]
MTTNRIRALRNEKELTLKALGEQVGLASNTLSQYETGKREPKLATWEKLADFFGVDVGYLQGVTSVKNARNIDMYGGADIDNDDLTSDEAHKRLFSYINKVGFDQFWDEGEQRIRLARSDTLSLILDVISESEKGYNEVDTDYNQSISNLNTRNQIMKIIENVTHLALNELPESLPALSYIANVVEQTTTSVIYANVDLDRTDFDDDERQFYTDSKKKAKQYLANTLENYKNDTK